jgi:predicted nucleic acid-binding protein
VALVVLDASVIIAFLDPEDPHHESAVDALAQGGVDLVVPASAYAEILVHPYRRRRAAHVERLIAELPVRVQPIDADVARAAARLRAQRPRLGLPDALVVATGDVLDADAVLTADASWPKMSRRARTL